MGLLHEIALIASIASGALFYTGFGLTRLLAFGPIRGVELLLAPFLGFSLIAIVGHWCGRMGWPIGVIAVVVLALATLFNLLALLRRRGTPPKVLEHLPIFVMAFIAFAVAVYPVWRSRGLGPIGTNGDQVLYTSVATHLERDGFLGSSPTEWKPALVQLSMAGKTGFPLGFSYLHAVIDKLVGAQAYETFALVTAISLALIVLSYAALAVCLFRAGPLCILAIALFTAVSPALLWAHYESDGMQVISLGVVPLAFGLSVLAVEHGRRYILLPALLLAAAFVTHPMAAIAFSLGPAVVYVVLRSIWQRHQLASGLRALTILLALAAFLALPGLLQAGKFSLHMVDFGFAGQWEDVGRSVRWLELYGLSQHRLPVEMNPLAFFRTASLFLAVCAGAITLYGVWGLKGSGRTAILSLGILYSPCLILLHYVLDYPAAFFKVLTFATFPVFTGFALGCERLVVPKQPLGGRNSAVVMVLLLIVATNAVYLVMLSRWAATLALDFPSLLALRQVKGLIREAAQIHVRDARDTPLLWIAYFLKDYDLSLAHYAPSHLRQDWPFYQQAIRADFVLVEKGVPLAEPWAMAALYENGRYKILRKAPNVLMHLDFRADPSVLRPGQELQLEIWPEMLVVDGQAVPLTPSLASTPAILRVGAFARAGGGIEVGIAGRRETVYPAHDLHSLEVPLEKLPITVTLTNAGTQGILLTGWLELVDGHGDGTKSLSEEDLFVRLREEVLPGSGFFVADGWHGLERGRSRWTKAVAFAIFRNPLKPLTLRLGGFLPFPLDGASPVKAHVYVNGRLLGEFNEPGSFAHIYFLPVELLKASAWAELALHLDRTLNLKALGLSEDARDLGISVNHVELLDLNLPPEGLIDVGTQGARKYLTQGWSVDEQLDADTFAWALAQESRLRVSFPQPRDFRVEMRLLPFRYASAPPQEIGIYVNGRHLQDISLESIQWQIHAFKLPQAFLSPGLNTFRFTYRYAVAPSAIVPGNPDGRTLAAAFDFLMFRPE